MIPIQEKTAEYAAPDQYDAGQRLHTPEQNISARRFGELDAIRGIAALIVVFHHCLVVATSPDFHVRAGNFINRLGIEPRLWLELPPFRLLFAGHAAVGVFFVLSGFVLTLPILTKRQPSYARYLTKRFFRLYVPFAVAILFAALICSLIQPRPIAQLNDWFNASWSEPISIPLVLDHLAMTGRNISLDNPMWSLVFEVRISFVFPLLALGVLLKPRISMLVSIGLVTLLSLPEVRNWLNFSIVNEDGKTAVSALADTICLSLYFVIGILLAAHHEAITQSISRIRIWQKFGFWMLTLFLLEVPAQTPYFDLVFIPPGAGLLIVLCLSSPAAKRILSHSVLHWLGRVSYSLYLTHVIVLVSLVHLLFGKMPLLLILSLAFVLSLIVAELMCRLIELPAQRMGKRMARLNNK